VIPLWSAHGHAEWGERVSGVRTDPYRDIELERLGAVTEQFRSACSSFEYGVAQDTRAVVAANYMSNESILERSWRVC
jgi:hypothetical protein